MVIAIENFKGKNMSEDFMLTNIVGFVEAFGPFLDRYFNSMNSISPETKREMAFGATQEEMEWCDDDYEDGIRW